MDKETVPELSKKQNTLMQVKFLLFSISAGVIQIIATTLLNTVVHIDQYTRLDEMLGNDYGLSYFIGLLLSVVWNFTLNRKFTFKSAANVPVAMLKILGFYCVFAPLSIWWTVRLTDAGWSWLLVQAGTMIINFITEFLFCRFVVYRNNLYTNENAKRELENSPKSDGRS